jgi:succinoglycan biosynthesis transport protein ExoP
MNRLSHDMHELNHLTGNADSDPRDLAAPAGLLRRHLPLSVAIIAGCLLLAAVFSGLSPKSYTATATLTYDPQVSPVRGGGALAMTDAQRDAEIDAQLVNIAALPVAVDVAGSIDLSASPRLRQEADDVAASSEHRISRAEALGTALLAHVTARRVGQTPVLTIGFAADSAPAAAQIANGFAASYLKLAAQQKRMTADAAARQIDRRIAELHDQVGDAESQVAAFRLGNDLLTEPGSTAPQQDVSAIRSQLAEAQGQAAQAGLRAAAGSATVVGGGSGGSIDTSAVSMLMQQRAAASGELAGLLGRYGEKYPDVIAERQKLAEIETQLAAAMHGNRNSAAIEAHAAAARSGALAGSLQQAEARLAASVRDNARLTDLQNQALALRQAYQDLLKIRATGQAERALIQPDAQQVGLAGVPLKPSSLRLSAALLIGLGLGIALSAMAAFVRDSFDWAQADVPE